MNRINKTILDFMGETPIVKLDKVVPDEAANVYVKLEEFNPAGSIKSRVALKMICNAEKSGLLKPNSGQTLVEPAGGNTGLGLGVKI